MSKDGDASYAANLKAVPESDITDAVDSWVLPMDLSEDILMSPRRFLGERFWKFDQEKTILIPMPALAVRITILAYVAFPVLVHNHREWMLKNQDSIPEEFQKYEIYFIGDTYLHHREDRTAENVRHIYRIVFKDKKWIEEEACLNHVPQKPCHERTTNCRIIMMR